MAKIDGQNRWPDQNRWPGERLPGRPRGWLPGWPGGPVIASRVRLPL